MTPTHTETTRRPVTAAALGLRHLERSAPPDRRRGATSGDPRPRSISTSALLASLSTALDLTEGMLPGHALRTCFLASRVAERLGLPEVDRQTLYFAALLKDAGCSSNAAAIAGLFGVDEIELKGRQTTVERSVAAYVAFTMRSIPSTEPLPLRLRRLVRIALSGPRERRRVEQLRCERGAAIALKAGFGDAVGSAIMDLHEQWDGGGMPAGRRMDAIDPAARILATCAGLDAFISAFGPDRAVAVLRARRGTWYDPDVVDALLSLCTEGIVDELHASDMEARTRALEPGGQVRVSDDGDVDRIAGSFADIIDAKSPFTGTHSRRVAQVAEALAVRLGVEGRAIIDVRRAGLLHDLGKLGVPNIILDKPGRLTVDEFALIQRHPEMTHRILNHIPTFSAVADVAASHHERLDGRGYFRGLSAPDLALGARIVAVADVYEALTADRPYRAGMAADEAMRTVRSMTGDHLAVEVTVALEACLAADPELASPTAMALRTVDRGGL